jgi:hypothetical protein
LSSVLYISFILTCTYTCVFVDERRFLRPCYTVKQVSRYLYHATFCIVILVSLHTKSSSMFHAECLYKLFPPKWRNLTTKTLSYKLKRLSICSFDQITSLLFPLSSHVLFTMCWPCAFICWWCCNLLTSNQDLWLVRDKNVSWSLLYRIEHVLSQSVYHATSKSCVIQSNSTVYTVLFGLWYKYHDTCFTV